MVLRTLYLTPNLPALAVLHVRVSTSLQEGLCNLCHGRHHICWVFPGTVQCHQVQRCLLSTQGSSTDEGPILNEESGSEDISWKRSNRRNGHRGQYPGQAILAIVASKRQRDPLGVCEAEPLRTPMGGNSALRSQNYILEFKKLHSISDSMLFVLPPHLSITSLFKYTGFLSFKSLSCSSVLKRGSKISPQKNLFPFHFLPSLYARKPRLPSTCCICL